MMSPEQLKGMIRNISKEKGLSSQEIDIVEEMGEQTE